MTENERLHEAFIRVAAICFIVQSQKVKDELESEPNPRKCTTFGEPNHFLLVS